jgi:hypothetical protein
MQPVRALPLANDFATAEGDASRVDASRRQDRDPRSDRLAAIEVLVCEVQRPAGCRLPATNTGTRRL